MIKEDGKTGPSRDGRDGPVKTLKLTVSNKRKPQFYIDLGKRQLESHQVIELSAFGNAVAACVITA